MTLLLISEGSLFLFGTLAIICWMIGRFLHAMQHDETFVEYEKRNELDGQYYGQIFVIKEFSDDAVFVERCINQGKVFYSIVKGAHYYKDGGNGQGVWVDCMISRDPGFWSSNIYLFRNLKQNTLFQVTSHIGEPLSIEVIPKEKGVFLSAVI